MQVIYENKRVNFDFEVIKKYVAGMVLFGWEVKQIRACRFDLSSAYVKLKNGRAVLKSFKIAKPKDQPFLAASENLQRDVHLLLKKSEIYGLELDSARKGLTVVPISIISDDRNLLKIVLALVRGKKKCDKRLEKKRKQIEKNMLSNY
ncbi:SsrA-binding protein [Candidatus Dojkabacteria bacterium]|uniref:SsrA-binding protein n=1 Tax=Candidatus Dojkabacteria bacterium TaxID=2099670 RepID=A0A3M0Z4V7_9BACT|nr:MAG: SsrA-binding protein [Candidatus Dojkabacteria bacterium]